MSHASRAYEIIGQGDNSGGMRDSGAVWCEVQHCSPIQCEESQENNKEKQPDF